MLKAKLLVGLVGLVAALVVSAAPASAWFESNTGKSQGKIITFPKKSTFKTSPSSNAVECKSETGAPAGEWEIQNGQTQGKAGFRPPATVGPFEQLKISKWGSCLANGILVKVRCALQVDQQTKATGEQKALGGPYAPGCEVFIGNSEANDCIIKVAVEGNVDLSEVKLANKGVNEVEINSEVIHIVSTTEEKEKLCKTLLIEKGSQEGTFKTEGPLVTEGQKLI